MNKRFILSVVGLLVVGIAAVWLIQKHAEWQNNELHGFATALTEKQIREALKKQGVSEQPTQATLSSLDLSRTVRLAIGGLGLADEEQNRRMGDLIVAELTGTRGLDLVERQSLDVALREEELSLSSLVRAKDAVRVGKLLRADWFLLGGMSSSTEGKAIVARIVDAHSGIMRDVTVIKLDDDMVRLACELAVFVRQSRQTATTSKPRVFLAVGTFADLSVNNRQADLPVRLRSALTATCQDSEMTLLEREYVNTLLQEIRLDLAGLTEDGSTNPAMMQSAMWLVDGYYQSLEDAQSQVELVLRVNRIFGRTATFLLRAPPGEALVHQVKESIDKTLAKGSSAVSIPTRRTEIKAQMAAGKELFLLGSDRHGSVNETWDLVYYKRWPDFDAGNAPKRRRNLEEAIRAFETVLLLEPENREAKIYLAGCLREPILDRLEEARNYYREIIASPGKNQWTTKAMSALGWTYRWINPREAAKWFHEAGDTMAENEALADAVKSEGVNERTIGFVEARLIETIRECENVLKGKGGTLLGDLGMWEFVKAHGTNRADAVSHLAALMPKLKQTFPDIVPYLLNASVMFQVDTNAPVIAEFRSSLKTCVENPKSLIRPAEYFDFLRWGTYGWCLENKQYSLAAEIGESRSRMAKEGHVLFDTVDKIMLAYAYRALERWKDALQLYESLGHEPVEIFPGGPWGRGTLLPSEAVAKCRAKLGLPAVQNLGQFDLGAPCLCLHEPSAFVVEGNTLWIAIETKLIRLDSALKTNLVIDLPEDGYAPVGALCVGSEKIWIGTAGGGLIECDKSSRECHRLTEKDGLLLNEITCLHLRDQSLWIGYGHLDLNGSRGVGGLGVLDLRSRRFRSFTPPLSAQELAAAKESADGPPRSTVLGIVNGKSGEICLVSGGNGLQHFRIADSLWAALPGGPGNPVCLTTDADRLFVGVNLIVRRENENGPRSQEYRGGVNIIDLQDGRGCFLSVEEGLPDFQVSTLTVDGLDLWIGGKGFIAVADVKQNKVRKVSYVKARSVDCIHVGGGYVWAQFDGHLYRASLGDTR